MQAKAFLTAAALALMASASALSATAAELISNGGFETGNLTGWSITGSTLFTGVDTLSPHSGSFAYFDGTQGSNTVISQTVGTVAGQSYDYSFWLRNEGSGGATSLFSATLGGQLLTSLSNAAGFGYTHFSGTVVAAASNQTLSFTFRNDPSFWDFDDASLTGAVIPEPATWAMLVIGFGGLGASLRARRRRLGAAAA